MIYTLELIKRMRKITRHGKTHSVTSYARWDVTFVEHHRAQVQMRKLREHMQQFGEGRSELLASIQAEPPQRARNR